MQKNRFSSVADKRWQRRYERVQQRKEREQHCKEFVEKNSFDGLYQYFEMQCSDEVRDFYVDIIERRLKTSELLKELLAEFSEKSIEPDLDAGDNSALDSFLGRFLAPEAYFQKQ